MRTRTQSQAGFFAFDCLLTVALLAVLGVLYATGSQRAALRKQAEEVKEDLASLASAMAKADKAAAAPSGVPVAFATLHPWLQADSRLAKTGVDALGHPFARLILGQPPSVPSATAEQLSAVVDEKFWHPYPILKP